MDKQTLSNYGWVIITVLVLAVMIALATPFGSYIKEGAKSTLTGLFESSENALNTGLNEAGVTLNKAEFGGVPTVGNDTDAEETIVGSATFSDGTTLTWEELQLPENGDKYNYCASEIFDTVICDYAFEFCSALTSITIPNSVTSIGNNAFYGCTILTSISIPDSVTSIGNWAFGECYALRDVVIADGLTNINGSTFGYCVSLTSITIPDSVTSISAYAFNNSVSLENIIFNGTKAQWSTVSLGEDWTFNAPATVVHCTDGDVAI